MVDLDQIKKEVNLKDFARDKYGIMCDAKGKALCPFHEEKNPSFEIGKYNGQWYWKDWHDDKRGSIIDLVSRIDGIDEKEVCQKLLEEFDTKKSIKKKVKEINYYIYQDLDGRDAYKKVKRKHEDGSKDFWIELKDDNKWRKPRKNEHYRKFPYNLNRFKNYDKAIVCEGEKDSDTVNELNTNFLATSAPFGCKSWPEEITCYFKGFTDIIFLYDVYIENGKDRKYPEMKHAQKLKEKFPKINIYIAKLPMENNQADITDYLDQFFDPFVDNNLETRRRKLLEVLKNAEPFRRKPGDPTKAATKKTQESLLGNRFTAKQLLETELPPEKLWIGRGLLPERGYMMVAGYAKQGKTVLCLQMGLSLISAHPFLESFPIQKKAKVLFLFAENTVHGLKEILKRQIEGTRKKGWKITYEDLEMFQFEDSKNLMINTKDGHESLTALIEDIQADIVIIDPIGLYVSGDILRLDVVTKYTVS